MIRLICIILLLPGLQLRAQNTSDGCSIWRRDVKILADLDKAAIERLLSAAPRNATVKELNGETLVIDGTQTLLTNGKTWENVKRQPSENYTVMIVAKVVACGMEANDKDYHIVLQDLNSDMQMVAEIPDPDCPDVTNESLKRRFTALRTWFDNNVETPGREVKQLEHPVIVTLVGIPFWDGKHPGEVHGAAINYREIHPVLKFVTEAGQEIPFLN